MDNPQLNQMDMDMDCSTVLKNRASQNSTVIGL